MTGAYTIVLYSCKDEAAAQYELRRLVNKSLDLWVMMVSVPNKGSWYRVCSGEYSNQAEAHAKAISLKDVSSGAFVARIP